MKYCIAICVQSQSPLEIYQCLTEGKLTFEKAYGNDTCTSAVSNWPCLWVHRLEEDIAIKCG